MIPWWRRPMIAPVYAAVTAFAIILALGAVLPADQVTVIRQATVITVVPAGGGELPKELTADDVVKSLVVTIRDQTTPAMAESGPLDDNGHYVARRSLTNQQVCLKTPPGWKVTVESPKTPTEDQSGLSCTTEPVQDSTPEVVFTLVSATGGG